MSYYALWRNRNGLSLWSGPHETNVAASSALDLVIDKSGGSLVTKGIPMTSGERLEALPILEARQEG